MSKVDLSSVDSDIAAWRRWYSEWCEVDSQLRRVQARDANSGLAAQLRAKARLLERRCEMALAAVDTALARRRATDSQRESHPQS